MNTATGSEAMANIKISHMRDVAARFLSETKAIHLERDLVDFLIRIDDHHQEEVYRLNSIIQELGQPTIT